VHLVGNEICVCVSNVIASAVITLLVYKLGEIKRDAAAVGIEMAIYAPATN
jgi:hypothetical protein